MGVNCSASFEGENSNTIRKSQSQRSNPWKRTNEKHQEEGVESTPSKPAQCYMMNPFEYMSLKQNSKEDSTFEKIIVSGRPVSATSTAIQKTAAANSRNLKTFKDQNRICEICWDEPNNSEFVSLENCQHIFHTSCIIDYLNLEIKNQVFSPKCPDSKCNKNIDNVENYLKGKDLENFIKAWESQHKKEVKKCRSPGCNFAIVLDGKSHVYCLGCFNAHNLSGSSDKEFLKFVNSSNFRQCRLCNYWVEKNQGCNHMTCRCKYEFCYRCGAKWRTCNCS